MDTEAVEATEAGAGSDGSSMAAAERLMADVAAGRDPGGAAGSPGAFDPSRLRPSPRSSPPPA